jgi:hypothetical protein
MFILLKIKILFKNWCWEFLKFLKHKKYIYSPLKIIITILFIIFGKFLDGSRNLIFRCILETISVKLSFSLQPTLLKNFFLLLYSERIKSFARVFWVHELNSTRQVWITVNVQVWELRGFIYFTINFIWLLIHFN